MVPNSEVLVIGAGVAGYAIAAAFARQGRRVLVLERALGELDRIVGELLQPGGVAALSKLVTVCSRNGGSREKASLSSSSTIFSKVALYSMELHIRHTTWLDMPTALCQSLVVCISALCLIWRPIIDELLFSSVCGPSGITTYRPEMTGIGLFPCEDAAGRPTWLPWLSGGLVPVLSTCPWFDFSFSMLWIWVRGAQKKTWARRWVFRLVVGSAYVLYILARLVVLVEIFAAFRAMRKDVYFDM
ncbi:hypothetical protein BT67DRAFT_75092 [Trichocladium antarcticum]|uniref:Squalene monooxygenase n=1 Tax=Trichocladium antarcticum TaxID=1450529 RepID=A0AAN6UHC3_9PEZI|nr:hypothetical protein BT67DRAFT_75092 [Trichocladium antarcticum]